MNEEGQRMEIREGKMDKYVELITDSKTAMRNERSWLKF